MEALHRDVGLGHAAQHHNGRVGKLATYFAEKADAVQLGHAQVGDNQWQFSVVGEQLQALPTAACLEAGEPLGLEHPHHGLPHDRLVIHYQASHHETTAASVRCPREASRTSRTLLARASGENGFWRKGTPGLNRPRRMISSLV